MPAPAVTFYQRPYPSANSVLLHGPRPMLVDSGFGSDVPELLRWLEAQGTPAEQLALLVNTHHHCDHVGGNHALQMQFGVQVAAHTWEGALVNRRDPDACAARYLAQPVERYQVQHLLRHGDRLSTGAHEWQVLHTPGHTLGHLTLFQPESGAAVCGDALLPGDVGWVNPFREGLNALDRTLESLERLASLNLKTAYPGHGPAITDVPAAIASAQARLEKWQADPQKIGWHACKRIFTYALMIGGPMTETEVHEYLLSSPWFSDHAAQVFELTPTAFIPELLREMERAKAAVWHAGKLSACAPHQPPLPGWARGATVVSQWE